MRTPRVFISDAVSVGDRVRLPAAEGRHLTRVLRRRVGDRVQVLTQRGASYDGRIEGLEPHGAVVVEIEAESAESAVSANPGIALTLGLAVVKGQAFEAALRMATELGIDTVVPLFTSRTVVRWDGSSDKLRRYERVTREASKQCGRTRPLRLEAASEFTAWIEASRNRTRPGAHASMWIAVPGAPLPRRPAEPEEGSPEAIFAIGPEGGFTQDEVDAAVSAGWQLCGFPTPVLRTPTAVALVAALGLLWSEPDHPASPIEKPE